MLRLTPLTLTWRNYLYANQDGKENIPEDVLTRVSLIQNAKDILAVEILKQNPDREEIQLSKEEIEYQIAHLEDMAKEFSKYAEDFLPETEDLKDLILNNFKIDGEESCFYQVAFEWKELADNANTIIQKFINKFGNDYFCGSEAEDYLIQEMMELQISPVARKNLQIVKKKLDKLMHSDVKEDVESQEQSLRAEESEQDHLEGMNMSEEEFDRIAEEMRLEAQATQGMGLVR